ncbi:MAG TPA: hypothetical protein VII73_04670 [Caulobacteraceae bacterium]
MKIVSYVVSLILILLGAVWILQGVNVLPGSFMTGHIQWAIYGAILAALGIALFLWTRRGRRPTN